MFSRFESSCLNVHASNDRLWARWSPGVQWLTPASFPGDAPPGESNFFRPSFDAFNAIASKAKAECWLRTWRDVWWTATTTPQP